jgi:hypothetical protein
MRTRSRVEEILRCIHEMLRSQAAGAEKEVLECDVFL